MASSFDGNGELFVINFADSLPDMVFVVDESGIIRYANEVCTDTLGYKRDEVIDTVMMDLVLPEDRARTEQQAAEVMAGQRRLGFENRYLHKDGSNTLLSWSASWMAGPRLRVGVAREVKAVRSQPILVGELVVSPELLDRLAPYERKVLQQLLTELSEKQIADQLGLAVSTTHFYITGIFRKLKVRGRAGLMSLCMRNLVRG